jgi:uncharacterized damage-inducible protein DinB
MMLELLRDLFQYQAYADAAMLTAVRRHDAAARDETLLTLLHHILIAHRFWIHMTQGLPFSPDAEREVPELDVLARRYRETQALEREWLVRIGEPDLTRTVEARALPGRSIPVSDALVQVCLHSQGHRAQCAARLRQLGGEPPPLDFILWSHERPAPAWGAFADV